MGGSEQRAVTTVGAPRLARHADAALLRGRGTLWLLALPLLMAALLLVLPAVMTVRTAVDDIGWGGVVDAAREPLVARALVRTLIIAVVVTAVCLPCGVLYALAMVTAGRGVRAALTSVLLLTMWISLLARTYGWVIAFQPGGALEAVVHLLGFSGTRVEMVGTTSGIYPAMVHVMLPFMVLPIYAAAVELNLAQVRAAQSLGAGSLRVLWSIVLPQLRDGMLSGSILVCILSLGFFVTPALLGGPRDLTIATLINLKFQQAFSFGEAAALAAILLVGVLGLYVIADRLLGVSARWSAGA